MATQARTYQISNPPQSSSMARQAVINGNFDIWQRGTSITNPANGARLIADRYRLINIPDGGTPPTNIVHTKQAVTPGDLFNSVYFYRVSPDGAGSGFGADSQYTVRQNIEFGTKYLAGAGKQLTLSFYAKSSIGSKRLGFGLIQNYGTGGSPSANEVITGSTETLTSGWTKYSYTFTTNTLSGKTFGTSGDDYLALVIGYQWGSTTGTTFGWGSSESWVGSGDIDIAQVQLSSGNEVLPFQPKTYSQELLDCQRYYWRIDGTDNSPICNGMISTATGFFGVVHLPTNMRINTPTLQYDAVGDFQVFANNNDYACSTLNRYENNDFGSNTYAFSSTIATAPVGYGAILRFNGNSKYVALEAELG